ncbi:hypothetical protein [Pedobacter sp. UC225_65]|uniref:hypothetical protein n=1 Tax=Pedobacter sp. UC225_65 TaxID=3350173 RepID=UPI0036728737
MRLLLFLLLFCIPYSYASKEYIDEAAYYKANPNGKHDGKDGHWLKADRIHHTAIWSIANEVNLTQNNGFEQYDTIEERIRFLQMVPIENRFFRFRHPMGQGSCHYHT